MTTKLECDSFFAAVVQAAPQAFELDESLLRVEAWMGRACDQGVNLIVFPEAFLGGYPKGLDFGARVGSRSVEGRRDFARYYAAAVDIPGPVLSRLQALAAHFQLHVVMGLVEREGATLYCSVIYLNAEGHYLGKHRKLMPTAMERLIWGLGDGSTLAPVDSALGRIGAAICWENYMPQLRTALYAQGVQIYCAPTVDDRDTWLPSMRHIAVEGRCFVLSACQFARRSDYPADYACIQGDDPNTILIRGGGCIISPLGEILAAPVYDQESLLCAEIDLALIAQGKYDLDVCGHYARPDVFRLNVNTSARSAVCFDRSEH